MWKATSVRFWMDSESTAGLRKSSSLKTVINLVYGNGCGMPDTPVLSLCISNVVTCRKTGRRVRKIRSTSASSFFPYCVGPMLMTARSGLVSFWKARRRVTQGELSNGSKCLCSTSRHDDGRRRAKGRGALECESGITDQLYSAVLDFHIFQLGSTRQGFPNFPEHSYGGGSRLETSLGQFSRHGAEMLDLCDQAM